jgi:hypothetical protein
VDFFGRRNPSQFLFLLFVILLEVFLSVVQRSASIDFCFWQKSTAVNFFLEGDSVCAETQSSSFCRNPSRVFSFSDKRDLPKVLHFSEEVCAEQSRERERERESSEYAND